MKYQPFFTIVAALGLLVITALPVRSQTLELEEVASFPKQQVTGVTVSKSGRLFVNFPFWSDDHTISVLEIMSDGSSKPYPDAKWNSKDGDVKSRFVCVQSVYVDDEDMLWILDPASPKMEGIVPGGPKLLKVDLKTDKVVQTFVFDESVAPQKSYLNDIRVDTASGHAFITESGAGAILVLDLKSGQTRRLLDGHASTQAEKGIGLVVDGIKVIDPASGKAPQIHVDGLTLDKAGGWLYYHALTGRTLYRVKTSLLTDPKLSPKALQDEVENVATTPACDGMLEAGNGSIYITAIERNAIVHFDPRTKLESTILEDSRLQWPDTLSSSSDGQVYVTTSQIHRMPKYHGGQSQQKGPYQVLRFKLNPPPVTEPEKKNVTDPNLPPQPPIAPKSE